MTDKDLGTAAGDIFTTQIAMAIQAKTGGNVEGKLPEWWAEFIGMVLAELQSAGRLIPAGGMALTAEQVEDVRLIASENYPLDSDPTSSINRLRALFPATKPAEEVREIGWFRTMTRKFATEHFGFPEVAGLLECTHTASDGSTWGWGGDGDWELLVYPPAPAERAEEETKAEDIEVTPEMLEACANLVFDTAVDASVAHTLRGMAESLRSINDALDAKLASSPVVPASTETEWQRIEDVPEGVWVRGRDDARPHGCGCGAMWASEASS